MENIRNKQNRKKYIGEYSNIQYNMEYNNIQI